MNTISTQLGPQLYRHDAFFRIQRWEKIFLRQEIERELHQEATDFPQFGAGLDGVFSGHAGAGHVLSQDLIV